MSLRLMCDSNAGCCKLAITVIDSKYNKIMHLAIIRASKSTCSRSMRMYGILVLGCPAIFALGR